MEHWEFLLQKEGDCSWLPLESSIVEILEGRYQVLARSNLIDTTINVQVSHFFNRHGVPEQQLQEGSQKTNAQGVVVIIPSTYLQPGLWQLICTFNQTDQQNAWRQSIQLQVLHQEESDISEDWELNWQEQFLRESSNQPEFVIQEAQRREVAAITGNLSQDETNQVAASLSSPHVAVPSSSLPQQQVKASSPHLPNFTNQAQSLRFKVSEGQVFPPQLAQSHSSGLRKSLELPVVPRPKVSSVDIEMVRSYLEQAGLQKASALDHQPLIVETAFEALKLKERFRSRLNTFAKKTETEAALESNVTSQDATNSNQDGTSQTNLLVNPDQSEDRQFQTNASIMDVDSLEPAQDEALPVSTDKQISISSQPSSVNAVESESEIVPIPDLMLPEEELVMGQLITVRVTLPDPSTPLYVKLWIKDRQTRSLLDGPRWLVEFVLNEMGVQEASTQLMVPLGSLDVSFEAIAINVQTKSESYKATVNRLVMPLGLFLIEDSNSNL